MRIAWILIGVMALLSPARAVEIRAYVASSGAATPYPAMKMASAIFENIGVTLEWRSPKAARTDPRGLQVRIELAQDTQEQDLPGALAISYPFDRLGRGITVFLDRIRSLARDPNRESQLLAYVLVHEITHVIQGVDVHAAEGIMKAYWDRADRVAIYRGTLSFSPDDLQLIQQGLSRDSRRPSVPLIGPSLSGIAVHPE
jgi:hypothetical protein